MDNIKELGKTLKRTQKDTKAALDRDHPSIPIIHRSRDLFDFDHEFSMDFEVDNISSIATLSLFFIKGKSGLCPEQDGCVVGRCDYFSGSTDTNLITVYEYLAGTAKVYKNDVSVDFTETGINEVTLASSPLVTDIITVCYLYKTCEYDPDCPAQGGLTTYFIDDFSRIVSDGWGTASIGEPWIPENPSGVTFSVDGTSAHAQNISGTNPVMRLDVPNTFKAFLTTQPFIDILWLIKLTDTTTYFDFTQVYSDGPNVDALSFQYNAHLEPPSFEIFVLNNNIQTFTDIPATYINGDSFWVGWRLYYDGTYYFKHWKEFESEPPWGNITLPPSMFDTSFLYAGEIANFSMRFLNNAEHIFKAVVVRTCGIFE